MAKLLTVVMAAGMAFGLNAAVARDTTSPGANDWRDFQRAAQKCDTLTGAERQQCMTDAGDKYHAANFNCESMTPADKAQCEKYGEQWKSARANPSDAQAVRSGEPNTVPANPADPTDELKNRDSTKQHKGAASAPPNPQKQN